MQYGNIDTTLFDALSIVSKYYQGNQGDQY